MAKQIGEIPLGFRGRLGPVVGYQWNGQWCVRTLPRQVHNPRTEAQQAHRMAFRAQVRLAAAMRWAVAEGMSHEARNAGMTPQNLFVSLNQQAFKGVEVDYSKLLVACGTVAPVGFGVPEMDRYGSLHVDFEKNPMHLRSDGTDCVKIYLFSPELGTGYLSNGSYRNTRSTATALPQWLMGHEVHVYGYVTDGHGRCSASSYLGSLTPQVGEATATAEEHENAVQTPDSMASAERRMVSGLEGDEMLKDFHDMAAMLARELMEKESGSGGGAGGLAR